MILHAEFRPFDEHMFLVGDFRLEWLRDCRHGWQNGEQGLLAEMAKATSVMAECMTAVEIGGGDGDLLPLTTEPLLDLGFDLIVYECDATRRYKLETKYAGRAEVRGRFDTTSDLSQDNPFLVVIDVDSIDSIIMDEVLQMCAPGIICVEHYDKAAPYVSGMLDADMAVPRWLLGMPTMRNFIIQSPSEHLDALADVHGMKPVWKTRLNSCYASEDVIQELYRV